MKIKQLDADQTRALDFFEVVDQAIVLKGPNTFSADTIPGFITATLEVGTAPADHTHTAEIDAESARELLLGNKASIIISSSTNVAHAHNVTWGLVNGSIAITNIETVVHTHADSLKGLGGGSPTIKHNMSSTYAPLASNYTMLLQSETTNGSIAFVDSSQTNISYTVNGGTQHSTTQAKFGSSAISFDGLNSNLFVSQASLGGVLDSLTDLTIQGWVYSNTVGALLSKTIFDGGFDTHISIGVFDQTKLCIWVNSVQYLDAGVSITMNTWFHFAVVKEGTNLKAYINGVEVINVTIPSSIAVGPSGVTIGSAQTSSSTDVWDGFIEEIQITNTIALYADNFTPRQAPANLFPDSFDGYTASLSLWQDNASVDSYRFLDNTMGWSQGPSFQITNLADVINITQFDAVAAASLALANSALVPAGTQENISSEAAVIAVSTNLTFVVVMSAAENFTLNLDPIADYPEPLTIIRLGTGSGTFTINANGAETIIDNRVNLEAGTATLAVQGDSIKLDKLTTKWVLT